MSKARVKFGIFVIGISLMAVLALLGLSLLSNFMAAFQQGADPASIFRGHTLVIPNAEEARWISVSVEDAPTRSEQEEIIAAYWLAWEALRRAYETGDVTDIATYWAGAAYRHALSGFDPAQRTQRTHSRHALRLTYFSDDGSVVAFEDENFILSHLIDNSIVTLQASASIIMTLDQGFWRIRSINIRYN